jgi:hypothetical protein
MLVTRSELINKPGKPRPHVLILGAGASVAAFPDGDASGKRLPTMDNLIEIIGLGSILEETGVEYKSRNFEVVYSEIYEKDPKSAIIEVIEEHVRTYFKSMNLPEQPTLYDHVLLSLRPKDLIVSFNWDPFLYDAWYRNRYIYNVPLPQIAHLHGNVRIGYCPEHHIQGDLFYCPVCGKPIVPSRLLFPVVQKNYADDPFIKTEWDLFRHYLPRALTLTIFGYGAPSTDKEAVDIMKSFWRDEEERFIERVEVIDIREKSVLWSQWDPLIVRTYFDYAKDFYGSRLAMYPRRSCEALINQTVFGHFVENNSLPRNAHFDELMSWLSPLLEAERELSDE